MIDNYFSTVPEISLEYQYIDVKENESVASICIVLKSDLKFDINLYLTVTGLTATGEYLIMFTTKVLK